MRRMLDLQTYGSLAAVASLSAAEAAARFLEAYPGHSLAWYLNLELFHVFELARVEASPARHLFGPATLPLSLVAIVLIVVARLRRSRLGLAVFANLGFLLAVALAAAYLHRPNGSEVASLGTFGRLRREDGLLPALVLATSFLGFLISHVSFIREIRAGVDRT